MRLNASETSLVITGAWNPAILTPQWILGNALDGVQDTQHMVHALIPAGLNGVFEFPRFTLPGFQYIARPDALVAIPNQTDEASLNSVDSVCDRILSNLTHTPINGLGHNFEFVDEDPKSEWLAIFSDAQGDLVDKQTEWTVTRSTVATSFAVGLHFVNIQRYLENNTLVMKFNFHHPINNATTARQVLTGQNYNKFAANCDLAKSIAAKLYGDIET